jgi:hypothetical protein
VRLIRQPDLLQHDRHLHAIRRRQRIKLQPVGVLCGPALGDGEGGEGHGFSLQNDASDQD